MRIPSTHTLTSLLTAFLFVVAFTLTGCNPSTLTGPELGPETTVQSRQDDDRNNGVQDDDRNNKKDDDRNNKKDDDRNK